MKIRFEFVKRDIAGETFLVPIGNGSAKFPGLFALTEVASFIWDQLPEVQTEDEIVDRILNEYDVTREVAAADTAEFVAKLREMEIID